MNKGKILWVDDEIDHLKAHIIFLEERGYNVTPVLNAEDAIPLVKDQSFDLVLLDEMMPGMDGLSALAKFKEHKPNLPVIMITKNEEESLMEDAIGSKIHDYLTKPVNPSQILMACKKILETTKIEEEHISRNYAEQFSQISRALLQPLDHKDWVEIYLKLLEWEMEIDQHKDLGLTRTLSDQMKECNISFSKFVERNYLNWIQEENNRPTFSTDIVSKYIVPEIEAGKQVFFLIIDCLRLDQWLTIEPLLYDYFNISKEYYYSIIPTATPYSRNAIFSGLFPMEIEKQYPDLWQGGKEDEYSRNRYEKELLERQLARLNVKLKSDLKYLKILDMDYARDLEKRLNEYLKSPLIAIVLNFLDILAHSRNNSEILKELAPDESAHRSLTKSWFEHSPILKIFKALSNQKNITVIVTSDHGSIRGMRGAKVIGDRETSTSLRYKYGKNLKVSDKHALYIKNPEDYKLPKRSLNSVYIIAKENYYFVYPTNYHHYLNHYKDSFQHGGISIEEIILPVVKLENG